MDVKKLQALTNSEDEMDINIDQAMYLVMRDFIDIRETLLCATRTLNTGENVALIALGRYVVSDDLEELIEKECLGTRIRMRSQLFDFLWGENGQEGLYGYQNFGFRVFSRPANKPPYSPGSRRSLLSYYCGAAWRTGRARTAFQQLDSLLLGGNYTYTIYFSGGLDLESLMTESSNPNVQKATSDRSGVFQEHSDRVLRPYRSN